MLTVLLGGARSGKSTAAQRLAAETGHQVTFIATAPRIEGDHDLATRIDRHVAERPSEWTTMESEIDLAGAVADCTTPTIVIDCLTTWVGNLMHHELNDAAVNDAVDDAVEAATTHNGDVIVVTNEVGSGIIPADASTRRYRDTLGSVNQRWVATADRAWLMVAGRALALEDPFTEQRSTPGDQR